VLSNSVQQLLFVITNGREEVHARTLMSVFVKAEFGCYFYGKIQYGRQIHQETS